MLSVSILGYNFSAPFFISPATRAAYGDPERAEINFVDAAAEADILYVVSRNNITYLSRCCLCVADCHVVGFVCFQVY